MSLPKSKRHEGRVWHLPVIIYGLDDATFQIVLSFIHGPKREDLPVILTGDFNALPDTEEIQLIHQKYPMQDSNLQPTFPHHQPIKKIDYIFADPRIGRGLTSASVPVEILHSDHLPLEAEFSLQRMPEK